ncbi:metal-dependent hydrolase [Naasia lichenicola]|nr:metal-dependent hydrolase [Naasia lichenicola]
MGFTHATSGTAAWLAVTAALPALGTDILPLTPEGVLAGTLVCAGAAILPDADHPRATIAHSVPIIGPAVTTAINDISGGHRHGAHTLIAAAAVTVGAVFLGRWQATIPFLGEGRLGPAIATVILIAFAAKSRELVPKWLMAWALGLVAAIAVFIYAPDSTVWFPLAVGIGYVTHIVGDALTIQGVPPLLWPISIKPPRWWRRTNVLNDMWKPNGYVAVPVLGAAGSKREFALAIVLGAYCCYGIAFSVFGLLGIPFVL